MPVNIHGNEYITVAERVKEAHAKGKKIDITSEVVSHNPVVVKATVVTELGTFTGISAANPSKAIEKMSPYEVAETSAVGRALGFAGFGVVDGIATADEMVKAGSDDLDFENLAKEIRGSKPTPTWRDAEATRPQMLMVDKKLRDRGFEPKGADGLKGLTKGLASDVISAKIDVEVVADKLGIEKA